MTCAALVGSFIGAEPVRAQIPAPANVPGKEYSNHADEDSSGLPDFLQNIGWNGLGGAADAFDYSGSGTPEPFDPDQVDALANHKDFLYHPHRNSAVPMLVSFAGIGDIYSHHHITGATAVWAQGPIQINSGSPPDDVDALEIWGKAEGQHDGLGGFDANHFSIIGDPLGNGTSVYFYQPAAHTSTPYINHMLIWAAVAPLVPSLSPDQVDVDALMVDDLAGDGQWGGGDSITFSLRAAGSLDGGEIFVWTNGMPAQFLVHGGRTWDTANPVGAIFGVGIEEINALEAIVPGPSSVGMMLIVGAGAFARRRRGGTPADGCV